MKKILFSIIALVTVALVGCEKDPKHNEFLPAPVFTLTLTNSAGKATTKFLSTADTLKYNTAVGEAMAMGLDSLVVSSPVGLASVNVTFITTAAPVVEDEVLNKTDLNGVKSYKFSNFTLPSPVNTYGSVRFTAIDTDKRKNVKTILLKAL